MTTREKLREAQGTVDCGPCCFFTSEADVAWEDTLQGLGDRHECMASALLDGCDTGALTRLGA